MLIVPYAGIQPAATWPLKLPGSTVTQTYDVGLQIADLSLLSGLSAEIAPSGDGEMTATTMSYAAGIVSLTEAGGQPTRVYTILFSATLRDGETVQWTIRQGCEPLLPGDVPQPIPTPGFGDPITCEVDVVVTQIVESLTANSDRVLLAANPLRRSARLIVLTGDVVVSLGFGATAVAGQGWPVAGPVSPALTGEPFMTDSTQDIHGICPSNATIIVIWE